MILNFDKYNVIHKARSQNTNGAGGVAILIRKDLSYQEINDEIIDGLECVAAQVHLNNFKFVFVSYYNPPQHQLNAHKITELQKKYKNLIMCGDLNAKSTNLGCKNNNTNGVELEDLLINSNLIAVNNKDILDWCLISNSIFDKFNSFEVLQKNLVDSDHFPIQIEFQFTNSLNTNHNIINNSTKPQFNYN
jgi:exonuclease III